MKNRLIIIFTLLCGVLFRVNAQDKAISEDLSVGGTQRNMLVYAPSNLPKNAPLLISMHGMNQDAPYQQGMANWEAIAKREKFVVVYPNGINKFWDIRNTSLPDNKDMLHGWHDDILLRQLHGRQVCCLRSCQRLSDVGRPIVQLASHTSYTYSRKCG